MFKNYSRVRLLTDAYSNENIRVGAVGYIVEVYPEDYYEIEFSDENGNTLAQIVARSDEVELYPESSEEPLEKAR